MIVSLLQIANKNGTEELKMQNELQTQTKPRVVLLYRASSKKQTDNENDIPLQRGYLRPWADRQGWEFVKEFVEGGISGYKVSASKRDAIQEIKLMAERKEFDILGIYMSDRLGRIADETPLIISFLNSQGIRIISYSEGEISSANHSDKLMTYIRYWQAEGESLKTSIRCKDAGLALIEAGKWRGGRAPYGYKTVSRGTLNFKGRPIFDVEIDEEEAEVVKDIFRLYTEEHMGTKLIARELRLKGVLGKDGARLTGSQICSMLRKKTYIGHQVLYAKRQNEENLESPLMPHLRIIEDEVWYKANKMLDEVSKIRGQGIHRRYRPTKHGRLLFSGLSYCGQCKAKMTSYYSSLEKNNNRALPPAERLKTFNYRCREDEHKLLGERCKPSIYKANMVEALIIKDAKEFLTTLDKDKLLNSHKTQFEEKIEELTKQLDKGAIVITQKEREVEKLKERLMQAILGEGNLSEDLIAQMLKTKEAELTQEQAEQNTTLEEIFALEEELSIQKKVTEELDTWSERFDALDIPSKKAMLINIIERVEFHKDRIEVDYKVKLDAQNIEPLSAREAHNDSWLNPTTKHTNETQSQAISEMSLTGEVLDQQIGAGGLNTPDTSHFFTQNTAKRSAYQMKRRW